MGDCNFIERGVLGAIVGLAGGAGAMAVIVIACIVCDWIASKKKEGEP
jgi:hypothetical protein